MTDHPPHDPGAKLTIAAGCFGSDGFGKGFPDDYPFEELAGITLKTTTLFPRSGFPEPVLWHGPHYSLNAVGLSNPGIDRVCSTALTEWRYRGCPVGVSVWADQPNDWRTLAIEAEDSAADYVELNLSCPNVSGGVLSGRALLFAVCDVIDAVSIPVYVKVKADHRLVLDLLANCSPDRVIIGNSMEVAALPGLLSTDSSTCSMSGPPLLPLHVRTIDLVKQTRPDAHITACGGISGRADMDRYAKAGAESFQIGTAALKDPYKAILGQPD